MDSRLVLTLVFSIIIGWVCIILILLCLWVLKGDFKSSYNYRPWKPFIVPEDLADKANKEGAKWLLSIAVLTFTLLVFGVVYGLATGDYNLVPFIVMPVMLALMIVIIICVYLYSWLLLQRRNTGKI